ncbi:hypothetical protein V500_05131 [Pseudogymnoascus sp. VKM F-4518 (FW-2643)]|nr:hypothetical protein V500_05131 [Pseudogymnoascus sp. VKM F-4518 (FW-2643)]
MTEAKAVDDPKTYKAAIYDKPGSISTKIVELSIPEPGHGEVLVRLTHSGVCGSDLSIMTNAWSTLPFTTAAGQIGGHEGVGIVEKLGIGADATSVKVGDRVGIKWATAVCGSCDRCRKGFDGHCTLRKISGYYTPGTFAEYVLSPANYVTPIPEKLASADAAPMLCAGLTSYSALRKCKVKSGEWVVISGAGGGLGISPFRSQHTPWHIDDEAIAKEVKRVTGGLGASAVILCAGSNKAYGQALPMLSFGGVLVCVGMLEGQTVPISTACPGTIAAANAHIIGSTIGSQREAIEVLDFAARGIVKTRIRLEKIDKLDACILTEDSLELTRELQYWGTQLWEAGYVATLGLRLIIEPPARSFSEEIDPNNLGWLVAVSDGNGELANAGVRRV